MLAITIGNFDGVHLGHSALVQAARRLAGVTGRVVAVTFEPHPAIRLRPDRVPPRLTDSAARRGHLLAAGADEVLELDPTPELLGLAPRDFLVWLRGRLAFAAIVEGMDFRFGHHRAGSVDTLRQIGGHEGFAVEIVPPVRATLGDRSHVSVSSTLARWLLGHGRVRDAREVLGRPYSITAPTARGDQRGRTIGVPTMNLSHGDVLLPADGVYSGQATLPDGATFAAAISVGLKPTFEQRAGRPLRTCEAHLLDASFPMDWYGFPLRVEFHHWIRGMFAFPSVDTLVAQMGRDLAEARWWQSVPSLAGSSA